MIVKTAVKVVTKWKFLDDVQKGTILQHIYWYVKKKKKIKIESHDSHVAKNSCFQAGGKIFAQKHWSLVCRFSTGHSSNLSVLSYHPSLRQHSLDSLCMLFPHTFLSLKETFFPEKICFQTFRRSQLDHESISKSSRAPLREKAD